MALVSFIIPVRNDAARLRQCLESISHLDTNEHSAEIIVVDNGSSDGSISVADSMNATVISLPDLPVAQLRNRGAEKAAGEFIAFIDADHTIANHWLSAAMEVMKESKCGIVGAPYSIPEHSTWVQRSYDRFRSHPDSRCEAEWLGSGNLIIRRNLFLDLGGFDESLETCEDIDLCNRVRKTGWRIIAEPQLWTIHFGDPSTLRGLFYSELWRGRDNWRVTLRGPKTFKSYAGLLVPLLNLAALVLMGVGVILAIFSYHAMSFFSAAGLAIYFGLAALIAVRLSLRNGSFNSLPEDFLVAAVYNLARSFALILRASHKTRRIGQQTA